MGMLDGLIGQLAGNALGGNNAGGLGGMLGNVLGGGQSAQGGLGGMLGSVLGGQSTQGGLGGMLGSVLGGGQQDDQGQYDQGQYDQNQGNMQPQQSGGSMFSNPLLMMLLPVALAWVQRQGGISAVWSQLQNMGLGQHAQSWLGTGENAAMPPEAVDQLIGGDEVQRLAAQNGVEPDQVREGFASLLPQLMDHLSPNGQPADDHTANNEISNVLQQLGPLLSR